MRFSYTEAILYCLISIEIMISHYMYIFIETSESIKYLTHPFAQASNRYPIIDPLNTLLTKVDIIING